MQSYVLKKPSNLTISVGHEFFFKLDKRRAFNKAVGPGKKNPKLINIGPTFIPDYRVIMNGPYLVTIDI